MLYELTVKQKNPNKQTNPEKTLVGLNFPGDAKISFSVIRWITMKNRKNKAVFPTQGCLAGVGQRSVYLDWQGWRVP